MTTEPLFRGVGVALVTLFDPDGTLDAKATAVHAATLVDLGVQAVVVAGTTGEASALDRDERRALVAEVRAAVSEVPVIVGTGAPWSGSAVRFTADGREEGADGFLVLSPPGGDLRGYYGAVAEAAGGLPVLAYHYPAVSPPGLPLDVLADLPVAGMKDSTGSPDRLLEELEAFAKPLYVGSSALLALAGPLGCAGAILALANAEPERCAAAFAGDAQAQRALARPHLAAKRSFPRGLKGLLEQRFGLPPHARLG